MGGGSNLNKITCNISLVITIIGLLILITGTSYAVLRGNTSSLNEQVIKTGDVTLTLTENYESMNKKIMVLEDSEGLLQEDVYEFNIKNTGSIAARYDLSIINEVPSSYEGEVIPLEYIKVGLEINGEEYGPFNIGELEGIIDSNIIYRKEIINYSLRIWLDKEYEENIESIEGYKAFLKLKVEAEQFLGNLDKSGANEPVLASSMVPVYYDEEEGIWKKADETNTNYKHKWYDYNEKMWANSVTVSSTTRETYLEAELGAEVKMDDILTMQVWIPRFNAVTPSNYNGGTMDQPGEIEISFVKNNQSAIDAFTFGSYELEGFWIGKFENSSIIVPSEEDNTEHTVIIKPNSVSWTFSNLSTFFYSMKNMNIANNIYGFTLNDDTHMIKNSEWGAVSYLTQSKYGRCNNKVCTEVTINNCRIEGTVNIMTGIGADTISSIEGESYTTCVNSSNKYNGEKGLLASTTGNIYGVYDMSGGAMEFVMGNYNSELGSSGFNILPDAKYINIYTSDTYIGHALSETFNWYNDYMYLPRIDGPFIARGGSLYNGIRSGIFSSFYDTGEATTLRGSRLAISVIN